MKYLLYRIIGNDIPGKHRPHQAFENMKFILKHEPSFKNCEKRWVINRIVDKAEEHRVKARLDKEGISYIHIPFILEEYKRLQHQKCPKPIKKKLIAESGRNQQIIDEYYSKLLYVCNINVARNLALKEGKRLAEWIMIFDGNSFIPRQAWNELSKAMRAEKALYVLAPSVRVPKNDDVKNKQVTAEMLRLGRWHANRNGNLFRRVFNRLAQRATQFDKTEAGRLCKRLTLQEDQICFNRGSSEVFDETYPYGDGPKVELLVRLKVPGKWDTYPSEYIDQMRRKEASLEAGNFVRAGINFYLNGMQSNDVLEDGLARYKSRQVGIQKLIDMADSLITRPN